MLYYIWLTTIKGIGPISQKNLLKYFRTPENIFRANEKEIKNVVGIGDTLFGFIRGKNLDDAQIILDKCDKLNIKILTYNDELYPERVKELASSPIVLYYRGTIRRNAMGVGIVGSRKCTDYGKEVVKEAVTYLAENDITVISGMAKGIDGYAHTACLMANGYTLAFLGNSVDICYPKEHARLMDSIVENGAVISEYPPTTGVRAEHFPRRNAIISSFSNKLLVVEAAHKSGALITARCAKELKREVYAAPNSIYSKNSYGANRLIKGGAKIYLKPSQLLDNPGKDIFDGIIEKAKDNNHKKEENALETLDAGQMIYSPMEMKILDFVKDNPKTLGQIADHLNCNEVEILDIISILEISGDIRTLPGGKICCEG
ncbi:MAG: DNA-processing protein DprA [Alkaliphilus sp.]|nr:DNA-processing protein DprA [Alkaliphilus sp.]